MFYSAGKNMRRLSAELQLHFRNLVVVQALGPDAKSLAATADQVRVLAEQAKGVDPSRVFRICDILADMEDKLRYVLSARTLIEMSLIRASRVATTATVEELMKAVRELKEGVPHAASAASVQPAAPVQQPPPPPDPPPTSAREPEPPKKARTRSDIVNDPRLNEMLSHLPGAVINDIKEKRK
jgi:DNA polymerase III gamma/tau subunit